MKKAFTILMILDQDIHFYSFKLSILKSEQEYQKKTRNSRE